MKRILKVLLIGVLFIAPFLVLAQTTETTNTTNSTTELHPAVKRQLDLLRSSPFYTPDMEPKLLELENSLKEVAPAVENEGAANSNYGYGNFTVMPPGVTEQSSFDITPTIPGPNEVVSVRVNVYSTDINKAKITWTLNNKVVLSDFGAKDFQFTTGNVGEQSVLKVLITKAEGGSLEKTLTFNPAQVDILYEADTYTPPFYKGRSLYGYESNLRLVAQTNFYENGKKIPDTQLIYKWRRDGAIISEQSGYGKNTATIKGSVITRANRISVEVSSVNSDILAKNALNVEPIKPEVLLYEDDPLLGIRFDRSLEENMNLTKDEVTLFAAPYYFSFAYPTDKIAQYDWRINSQKIVLPVNQNKVVFRNSDKSSGESSVSVNAKNINTLLQSGRDTLSIVYGKSLNNFSF